jgi:hypothetical protein
MAEIGLTGAIIEKEITDSWRLKWGIHDGTVYNRIHGETVTGLKSLEECRRTALDYKRRYQLQNYYMWFADAISPEGDTHQLSEFKTPYRD